MDTTILARRAPLAERLASARTGAPSPAATPLLVAGLATLPLDFAFQHRSGDLATVRQVLALKTLQRIDPAHRFGWEVEQGCLAQAAWAIEQLAELGAVCHDREQGERIQLRADRVAFALSSLPGQLARDCDHAWAAEGRHAPAWSVESASNRNDITLQLKGSPEQLQALYGALSMPLGSFFDACGALLDARARHAEEDARSRLCASRALVARLHPDAPRQVVTLALSLAAKRGRSTFGEFARGAIVRPLAALWASGALDGVRAPAAESAAPTRPETELERRLQASRTARSPFAIEE